MKYWDKNSPLSGSMGLSGLNTSLASSSGGQKEVKESIKQMDGLMYRIMIDVEKNTIEHLESMTSFFQEQTEEEGRSNFRSELLKYIQTEYRFQEMGILNPEQREFMESIKMCYRDMQDLIKKGLKTTPQEIDYLNFFIKILQIKESLLGIYNTLGNYQYPMSYGETIKQLQRFLQVIQKEKSAYLYQDQKGMILYCNFLLQELKALLQLTFTLQQQDNFQEIYSDENMLCHLAKLKLAISQWIMLFKGLECDYTKFKQIVFLQNFHLLLKAKLDFFAPKHKFIFKQPFVVKGEQQKILSFMDSYDFPKGFNSSLSISKNHDQTMNDRKMQTQSMQYKGQFSMDMDAIKFGGQYLNSNLQSSSIMSQNKLDQYLQDKHIFRKLFDKLLDQFPCTVVLILQGLKSDGVKQKLENLKIEDQLMFRQPANQAHIEDESELKGEYRIAFIKHCLTPIKFKENMKFMMEIFRMQIQLIDSYIECSKYMMNNQKKYLFYKLDEQYYFLFEAYEINDKKQKQAQVIIEFVTQLCEFFRNHNSLAIKESGKPPKTFSDFIKEKLDMISEDQRMRQTINTPSTINSASNLQLNPAMASQNLFKNPRTPSQNTSKQQ